MVGKATLPHDAEQRAGLQGMARPTEGLNALDQEREASMADEGGISGMAMESEDPDGVHAGYRSHTRDKAPTEGPGLLATARWPWVFAGVVTALIVGGVTVGYRFRRR